MNCPFYQFGYCTFRKPLKTLPKQVCSFKKPIKCEDYCEWANKAKKFAQNGLEQELEPLQLQSQELNKNFFENHTGYITSFFKRKSQG